MKLKLSNSLSDDKNLIAELEHAGIEISDDSELMIVLNPESGYIKCRRNGEYVHMATDDIIFAESFGHDVIVHTKNGEYTTSLRIKQLAELLPEGRFLRISRSAVVSAAGVTRIRAALNAKYYITMISGDELTVTRSYYYEFKNFFGI